MKKPATKSYALRIDAQLVKPLQELKKQNRRSLNAEINATLQEDEIRKLFQGMEIEIETGPPGRFSTFANAEMQRWGKIVRDSGIKPE